MSRGMIFGVVIALAAAGIGVVVVHAEFFGNATIVNSERPATPPSKGWLEKHYEAAQQAAQRSADETIKQDCAAVRKLGATNPNCPPQ